MASLHDSNNDERRLINVLSVCNQQEVRASNYPVSHEAYFLAATVLSLA